MMIRPASPQDVDAIADVHQQSIRQLCKSHYSLEQIEQWTAALRSAAYSALLNTHQVLVAEEDGALLGFGVLDPQEGFINATYVSPAASRRGVGRALMAAMERAAQGRGKAQLRLSSTLNAVGFYESLGYVKVGDATNCLPSGVELPCVTMNKILSVAPQSPTHEA